MAETRIPGGFYDAPLEGPFPDKFSVIDAEVMKRIAEGAYGTQLLDDSLRRDAEVNHPERIVGVGCLVTLLGSPAAVGAVVYAFHLLAH